MDKTDVLNLDKHRSIETPGQLFHGNGNNETKLYTTLAENDRARLIDHGKKDWNRWNTQNLRESLKLKAEV